MRPHTETVGAFIYRGRYGAATTAFLVQCSIRRVFHCLAEFPDHEYINAAVRRRRLRPRHRALPRSTRLVSTRTDQYRAAWASLQRYCYMPPPVGAIVENDIIRRTGTSWRRGVVVSGVRRMNEVNPRRARLVLGRVTVFGRVYHLGM